MRIGHRRRTWLTLVLAALVVVFALTGCGVTETGTEPSAISEPTAESAAAATVSPAAQATPFRLTILHNSDGESQLIDAGRGREDFGGAARFAALVRQLRQAAEADGGNVLVLSAGDSYLAGPEFSASLDRGTLPYYDTIALELIGYDAIAIGNHEFDFGPDVLADFIGGFTAPVPFVSANLDISGEPRLAELAAAGRIVASVVLDVGDERVGIVGATTPGLPYLSIPRNVRVSADVAALVQREVDALTFAGVNKVILISHVQGLDGDVALAERLHSIDITIAGGGDELLASADDALLPGDEEQIRGAYPLIVQDSRGQDVPVVVVPGGYTYVGRLIVEFDAHGELTGIDPASGPVRVVGGNHPDAVTPDPLVQEQVAAPVAGYLEGLAATPVGTTEVLLDGRRSAVRSQETNEGNLIADAILWQANELAGEYGAPPATVALQNGGGIRNNNVLPAGTVYEVDVFSMAPFPNFIAIVPEIPASQFKEILENAVSRAEHGAGRFPQIAGFRMTWDHNGTAQTLDENGQVSTAGTRVRDVQLADGTWLVREGSIVDGAGPVHVATLDFLARGGDEYPFRRAAFVSLGVTYQQAISNYVDQALGGVISVEQYPEGGEGRIVAVDSGE